MGRLQDKIIIVTGGARGIGAAFSRALAAEGAVTLVADIIDGGKTVQEIEEAGGRSAFFRLDVADSASVSGFVEQVLARYGRIDCLVNNAALFANLKPKKFFEIDDAEFDKVMAVNVRGPFLLCKAVAPGDDAPEERQDRQHRLGHRVQGPCGHHALRDLEGRHRRADAVPRA